jgi:hypothetical protein
LANDDARQFRLQASVALLQLLNLLDVIGTQRRRGFRLGMIHQRGGPVEGWELPQTSRRTQAKQGSDWSHPDGNRAHALVPITKVKIL